jgi:hypothetical protein
MTRRLLNYEKENPVELKPCYLHMQYYEDDQCKECNYLAWVQVLEREKTSEKKNYSNVNRKYALRFQYGDKSR